MLELSSIIVHNIIDFRFQVEQYQYVTINILVVQSCDFS